MSAAKLTDRALWYIRQALLTGSRVKDVARMYAVSSAEVLRVAGGIRRGGEQPGDPLVLRYNRRAGRWEVVRRAGGGYIPRRRPTTGELRRHL